MFSLERCVCDPAVKGLFKSEGVTIPGSENAARLAELPVCARVCSDSPKQRMFVSIKRVFVKRSPKMPASLYTNLRVFGRSP